MTTCEDSTGDLIGIQFTLAIHDDDSPQCPEDGDTCFESSGTWSTVNLMAPIGNLSGTCQTLTLSGQIDAIRAYYNESTRAVKSVQYFKDTTKKTYGEFGNPYEQWNFGDDNILLGLYGYTDGAVIKSLGFISLDQTVSSCPDEVDPSTEESSSVEAPTSDPEPTPQPA